MKLRCHICESIFDNYRKLSKHIRDKHKEYSVKSYYDTFIKKNKEGICKVCSNKTKWTTLSLGYKETCCASCAHILSRKILKNDKEKYKHFVNRVRKNQKEIWKQREISGEKSIILNKVVATIKKNNKKLTKEEMKEKYGWLNKLKGEKRLNKIQEILNKSLKRWWKSASEIKLKEVYDKRIQTRIKNGTMKNPEKRGEYEIYEKEIRNLTEKEYKKYKKEIDPENLRSVNFHLDHRISILYGFLNSISPYIISSKYNLQIISAHDNMTKHTKNSIEVEYLLKLCEENKIL